MASPLLPVRPSVRPIDIIAAVVPSGLLVAFLITYLVSPEAYLAYIINFTDREHQAVEILTFVPALLAAAILLPCAFFAWQRERRLGGSPLAGGVLLIGVIGLASLFLGGEEVSWGQTFFRWKTPAAVATVSRETNLHNGRFGSLVHEAGNIFIICVFILLPIAWSLRRRFRWPLPDDWRIGIAEWPIVTTTIVAMLLRIPKSLWMHGTTQATRMQMPFYRDYLEEIDEQKEMMIAIAILIYALYRIAAVRRDRAPRLTTGSAST